MDAIGLGIAQDSMVLFLLVVFQEGRHGEVEAKVVIQFAIERATRRRALIGRSLGSILITVWVNNTLELHRPSVSPTIV